MVTGGRIRGKGAAENRERREPGGRELSEVLEGAALECAWTWLASDAGLGSVSL